MNANSALLVTSLTPSAMPPAGGAERAAARELAGEFLGSTFYRVLMKSMRKTVPESAFFGSFANRVFQDFMDDEFSKILGATEGPLLDGVTDYIRSGATAARGTGIDVMG